MEARSLAGMTDDDLLRRLAELLRSSRRIESDLVAHIAEVDRRRLYAREAAPSMFAYCTEVLHLSEAEAYLRIAVARASREHPVLLSLLADGSLHLTGIALLAPHLRAETRDELLRRAKHCSKRRIEELIADLEPLPDAPTRIRKLPQRDTAQTESRLVATASATETAQLRPDAVGRERQTVEFESTATLSGQRADAVADATLPADTGRQTCSEASVQPLGNARYKIQFTASSALRDKLERLRALLGREVPNGDLATIIDRLVSEKLQRIEAKRFAKTSRSRSKPQIPGSARASVCGEAVVASPSRYIAAAVRRAAVEQAGDRCGYVGESGRRCSERHRLEFHHRHPFAMGGSHSPKNIGLLCRTHNSYLAVCDYGQKAMTRHLVRKPHPTGGKTPAT
jgi:hypothetical protein